MFVWPELGEIGIEWNKISMVNRPLIHGYTSIKLCPEMESAGCCVLKEFSYKDLKILTNSFSGENFIGRTQFGKVYRGKIQHGWKGMEAQDVTVKIWEVPVIMGRGQLVDRTSADENRSRLTDEITFLGQPSVKSHPNLVKLMGYCCEDEQLGVVYDLRSFDTVHNLAVKDSFNWLHRVKVALGFAHLLEFLHSHEPEYLVRNISAAHIMVDEDFNPKLFDFAMLTGGVVGDKTCVEPHYVYGSYGYIDPRFFYSGIWTKQFDIYSFGAVLLALIMKRVVDREKALKGDKSFCISKWAMMDYEPNKSAFGIGGAKCKLMHNSLEEDPDFDACDGLKITDLALRCVNCSLTPRPKMREVIGELHDLCVVCGSVDMLPYWVYRINADTLGIN